MESRQKHMYFPQWQVLGSVFAFPVEMKADLQLLGKEARMW
jgi:hypothetical protein